jgi:hypothetical protein
MKRMPMVCASAAFLFAAALGAQEAGKPAAQASPQAPPAIKPGPEHEMLKKDVGTWDATVEIMMPGAPTSTSKGVETNRMLGGLWLVTDFKSTMMGQPFQGHGVTGYDVHKKKYVGTWTDTMSTGLYTGESTYDPATRTVTGSMEGPDETGKPTRMKAVTQYQDDNTKVFTMYMTGPDGKEVPSMKITYKRRMAAAKK